MLNISTRLATLDPKARAATRTAKDGEEYSQLVLEVAQFDFEENELNAACGSTSAYRQIKAMFEQCPSVGFIELSEKIESASIAMRLAAVSERNGDEFAFKDCRVDKLRVDREMKGSLRMTTKPALDSKFGQLIERLGHTVMFQANGSSNSDQKELPLNKVGAKESAKSSIGSPSQEREKAHDRERKIAAERDTVKSSGAKHGAAKKSAAKRR
jgi:hypothetical protein